MSDWVEKIESAWKGHRKFAEWLVKEINPKCIVELGVDYGYSTFVFANALKGTNGIMNGIDWFKGDSHASSRDTYKSIKENITKHNVKNINIIKGDFFEISKKWDKNIDVLHIDGYHTYDAVKSDYDNWNKYVKNGIILFHDTSMRTKGFGVYKFFRELKGGHKLYFTHSKGLGIFSKNNELIKKIKDNFKNVNDFNEKPF